MPQRTLTVTHIQYHVPRKPQPLDVTDMPDKQDLLHLFHGLMRRLAAEPDRLVDTRHSRYVRVDDVQPRGRTVLVKTEAGEFGERGWTRDTKSHEVGTEWDGDHAAVQPTRVLFVVPLKGTSALLFIERAGNQGGGTKLLEQFRAALRNRYGGAYVFETEALIEGSAWVEGAELEQLEAVQWSWSPDIADAATSRELGQLKQILEPPRGNKRFSGLWARIRAGDVDPKTLLGFRDDDDEPDQIRVRLAKDGREKTFVLGRERTPSVRYLLTEAGQPAMNDDEFVKFCLTEARNLFPRVGGGWEDAWQRETWTEAHLGVEMEPLDDGEAEPT